MGKPYEKFMENMVSFILKIFKLMEKAIRLYKLSSGLISIETSILVGNLMENMVNFIENVIILKETTIQCHKVSICL